MILLEYEAKKILNSFKIPVPLSEIHPANEEVPATSLIPCVIKSQVPTGGRGKRGGIKIANTAEEFAALFKEVAAREIKEFTPKTLLLEEKIAIARELYLSLRIDRATESIQLMAHPNGGVEIEENAADTFFTLSLHAAPTLAQGEALAEFFAAPEATFALQDLLGSLYTCFIKSDATLIEINPLVITDAGDLIAGDCKMTLDDSAAFRHSDWQFEANITPANFVTLNPQGTVATIANGAGLAMATVDAVAAMDLQPANFLDIGGGANAESVLKAFHGILEYENVQAIIINIFAGITRCDEIAKAIVSARSHIENLPPLFIRLAGTNYEAAKEILDAENIPLLPTLNDCLTAAKNEVTNHVR